ncbi:MAG: DEAD/DEAH box helicase family protein [Gammaproteobacteria bacterium]|jgi:superfamily II DNA or RNA helicase|nr:DEAD/DEAH box helicase family protein [Gammaproteobacteria bacterium]
MSYHGPHLQHPNKNSHDDAKENKNGFSSFGKTFAITYTYGDEAVEQELPQLVDLSPPELVHSDEEQEHDSEPNLEEVPEYVAISDESSQPEEKVEIYPPCAGIDAKYLGGALPSLPEPINDSASGYSPIKYAQLFELTTLDSIPVSKAQISKRQCIKLTHSCCEMQFYSLRDRPGPNEKMTFIIAGRKLKALVPQSDGARCVLVMPHEDYEKLKEQIPGSMDILAIKSLKSPSHGNFTKLSLAVSRRLATFLFAYHFKLSKFLMIDDNIKAVKFNARNGGWDRFYQLLENQLDDLLCVSIRTDSYKESRAGELGSKMFMINLEKMREKILCIKDIFALFPEAAKAHYWGEDDLMQLAMYSMAHQDSQGYQILDKGIACLIRSKMVRNLFAQSGVQAQPFGPMNEASLQKLTPEARRWVEESRSLLDGIILSNIRRYEKRKRAIERADLQAKHAIANRVQLLDSLESAVEIDDELDFIDRYQTMIESLEFDETIFRPYQIEGMKSIANITDNNVRLVLATAAGKTFMQCELMRIAYHRAKRGEHIIVVTPHIDLVNQFYDDFIRFNEKVTTDDVDLRVPNEAIIKVCSHKQSCHVKALLMNESISHQTSILIFCSDSLDKFLEESEYSLPHVPIIFADEYHYYTSTVDKIVNELVDSEPLVIGSSATPPKNDPLSTTAFRYTRAQGVLDGYLAPVIADSLGVNYSKENVQLLITCLPKLLERYHPGFTNHSRLKNAKVIVYLPSIPDCQKAQSVLEQSHIRCYSIHSKNKKHKSELEEFLNSNGSGVILAVKMCKIGTNDPRIAGEIIGQNAKEKDHASRSNIEQMIGRAMRKLEDKIGYVLCFDNVLREVVSPMLASQKVTLPVSAEYLMQETFYYTKDKIHWFVGDNDDMELKTRILTPGSGYKIAFKIVPKPIRNFHIESHPDIEESEAEVELSENDKEDALRLALFGVNSGQLFSAYPKSKRKRSGLSVCIDAMTGDLSKWLQEEAELPIRLNSQTTQKSKKSGIR